MRSAKLSSATETCMSVNSESRPHYRTTQHPFRFTSLLLSHPPHEQFMDPTDYWASPGHWQAQIRWLVQWADPTWLVLTALHQRSTTRLRPVCSMPYRHQHKHKC